MGELSWWHWMIILAAFILLFGAKKLPDAARGLGRSLRILKSEVGAMHDEEERAKQTNAGESDAVPMPPAQIAGTPAPLPTSSTPSTVINGVPVVTGVAVDKRGV